MTTATKRRITLIRHAKAVEDDAGGDHTRPLQPRGETAAAELGGWLAAHTLHPQQVVCSTATRTRQTLAALALPNTPTILSEKLYLAAPGELLAMLQSADDAITDLMLIGHNPGLHTILALLVGDYADEADADRLILKFPTSACAVLRVDIAQWRDLAPHSATLELLRY
jgi:phosphohistidine phosphatase